MNNKEALQILQEYNQWRRGSDKPMPNPKVIGLAIDQAVKVLSSVLDENKKPLSFCETNEKK